MRYIAAYILATQGGKENPTAGDVEAILKAGGIEVDTAVVSKLVSELSGKDLPALIASGSSKLASMPAGGAASSAVASSAPAAAGAKAAAKEEKKVEEEEDVDMGFGLFD